MTPLFAATILMCFTSADGQPLPNKCNELQLRKYPTLEACRAHMLGDTYDWGNVAAQVGWAPFLIRPRGCAPFTPQRDED